MVDTKNLITQFSRVDYGCQSDDKYYSSLDRNASDGLGSLEEILQVIRHMFTHQEVILPNRFNAILESFDKLNEKLKFILLREIVAYETTIADLFAKIERHLLLRFLLSKLLKPQILMDLLLSASFDVKEILRNSFLLCRMLPPDMQRELYAYIGKLYNVAKSITGMNKSKGVFPKIEYFIQYLFSFPSAPVSYVVSAKTQEEHESAFTDAMWHLTPLVISSSILFVESIDAVNEYVRIIWRSLQPKLSFEEFSKLLLERVLKYQSQSNFCVVAIGGEEFFDGLKLGNKYVTLAIYLAQIQRSDKALPLQNVLKVSLSAFKDRSDEAKPIQSCLSVVLLSLSSDLWIFQTLGFARLLQKNRLENILLRAYTGLQCSGYKAEYFPDIARGLKTKEREQWINVLEKFLSREDAFKYRLLFTSYTPILKDLLETTNAENDRRFFYSICIGFTKVLLLSRNISSDDWTIIGNHCRYFCVQDLVSLTKNLLLESPPDEITVEKLVKRLLLSEDDDFETVIAMIRLFDSSKQQTVLAMSIANALHPRYTKRSPQVHWYISLYIAKKVPCPDLHEKLLDIFAESLRIDNWYVYLSAFEMVVEILDKNLLNKPDLIKRFNILGKLPKRPEIDDFSSTVDYYRTLLRLKTSLPLFKFKLSDFSAAAYYLQLHKTEPNKIDIADFKESFYLLVSSIFKLYKESKDVFLTSWILVQILKEFENEPYFDGLRKYVIDISARNCAATRFFKPSYVLSDAINCVKEQVQIPPKHRKCLFDVERLFAFIHDCTFEMKQVTHDVLIGVQAVAIKAPFDSALICFTVALQFLDIQDQGGTESFTHLILTQLARCY
jgi:hypothetical protein